MMETVVLVRRAISIAVGRTDLLVLVVSPGLHLLLYFALCGLHPQDAKHR